MRLMRMSLLLLLLLSLLMLLRLLLRLVSMIKSMDLMQFHQNARGYFVVEDALAVAFAAVAIVAVASKSW